jgi:hypothetical protein
VIYRQAPGVIPMQAPEVIFDRLEDAGYREFSPMARRGSLYKLNAVDPSGDLVALEISIFTGEIERAYLLQARMSPAPPEVAPRPRRKAAARKPKPAPAAAAPAVATAPPPPPPPLAPGDAPSTLRDRLEAPPDESAPPAGEEDPLVVY